MNDRDTETTEALVSRSQRGDLDAFDELVRIHGGWLRGMLRARLQDWTAADDLAQDSFVTAFRKIHSFRGDSGFEFWLKSIAINHLRNHIRKHREEYVGGAAELQALVTEAEGSEGCLGGSSRMLEALRDCLQKIDGPSKDLLIARYATGKTAREISEESGKAYSTLTMQLHRLRQSLAACIERKTQILQT